MPARSIVETYEGQPNAAEVAAAWKRDSYRGCWVVAIGTNDAADVYVGSNTSLRARIGQIRWLGIARNVCERCLGEADLAVELGRDRRRRLRPCVEFAQLGLERRGSPAQVGKVLRRHRERVLSR